MSPTARSLLKLRRLGFVAGVVERRLPHSRFVTVDFLGCIDLIAAHPFSGILGVQATSATNMAARIAKAREKPELKTWLAAGARWECWGWKKVGHRWQVRIVALTGDDLVEVCVEKPPRRGRKSKQAGLFA